MFSCSELQLLHPIGGLAGMFTCLTGAAAAVPVASNAVPSSAVTAPARSLWPLFMLNPFCAHTGMTGPCASGRLEHL